MFTKNKDQVLMVKLKKDKDTLHVIMKKHGSAVASKFCVMFVCNFTESLTCRRLTESKGK